MKTRLEKAVYGEYHHPLGETKGRKNTRGEYKDISMNAMNIGAGGG